MYLSLWLKISRVLLSFLLILSITGYASAASVEKQWKTAESVNTVEAYEKFIKKNRDSDRYFDALDQIFELRWAEAAAARYDTNEYYDRFLHTYENLKRYRDHDHVKRARENLDFMWAISMGKLGDLQKFLSDHPAADKQHRRDIEAEISVIEKRTEDKLYQLAVESGSYFRLAGYAEKYPAGRYSVNVGELLDSFSWETLSSPRVLQWDDTGGADLLFSFQLREKYKLHPFILTGCLEGGGTLITQIRTFVFTKPGTYFGNLGIVKPSSLHVSPISGGVVRLTIDEGSCLPVVNETPLLAVGSVLDIDGEDSMINFFGHAIRHGVVHVTKNGLELQSGTEVMASANFR